jgi:hypothetical protein
MKIRLKSLLLEKVMLVIFIASILTTLLPSARAGGSVGIYVDGQYYAPNVTAQNIARSSGYTSMFLFTLNVETNGDVTGFGATLCQNGVYTGDPTWGSKLAACKAPPSSVQRIELCIGSWGSQAFNNIRSLISSQGTGTNSILYRHFLALKNATGADAIQFDDELTYDVNSMVAFGNMLAAIGFKVTLCPYTNQSFWVSVKNQLGNKVDAIYLQCYDGGAGNDPGNWINAFGGFKVIPGLWGNTETLQSAVNKMQNWKNAYGIPGGFMWLNGTMQWDYQLWPPGFNLVFENPAVYWVGSYGNPGTALQGTNDPYVNSLSQVVTGCNKVAVTPHNSNYQQQWSIYPIGGGKWRIMNTSSGQLLQATSDPYRNNGGIVASCNKLALTPNTWNVAQSSWQVSTASAGGFVFSNPANSQYIQSTSDNYWSNANNNFVPGCYQSAGTPMSWGVGNQTRWNLIFVRP